MPMPGRAALSPLLLALFAACAGDDPPATKDAIEVVDTTDVDEDGFNAFIDGGQDCNDDDASIHPGAVEECDTIDQDCDGVADNGVQAIFYTDADGDGFGDDETQNVACTAPADSVPDGGDCDDNDATRSPALSELCNGIDDDCNSNTGEVALIGSASYDSVADAVAAALEGERIDLCDGTHTVSGQQVTRRVTIASASGDSSSVILEGDGTRSLFIVIDGGLTLEDLTLIHGAGSGTATVYGGAAMGGAVNALNAPLSVERCLFQENGADIGAAIAATELTVIDSTFENNVATGINGLGWGGAIYVAQGGLADISGSTFQSNLAEYGGCVLTSGETTISSSTMTGNTVMASAGGVYALFGSLSLYDTTISSNSTTFAGGVMLDGASGFADETTAIVGNVATSFGGGLLLYGTADISWTGGIIEGNTSPLGGGIFIDRYNPGYAGIPGSITVSDVIVEGNLSTFDAASSGGGIFSQGSPVSITDATLSGNSASRGGGMSLNITAIDDPIALTRVSIDGSEANRGGGIDMVLAEANLVDCDLSNNVSIQEGGGGVYVGSGSVLETTNTLFPGAPDENTPEDVLVNSGTIVVTYDYDGLINVKCDSTIPECI